MVLYQILRCVGKVVYEIELASGYPIFHVSILKKCVSDRTTIVPLEGLGVEKKISYKEVLDEILDRQFKKLRNKKDDFVKSCGGIS